MKKRIRKLKQRIKNIKVGRPPGEAIYVGESSYEDSYLVQRIYDEKSFDEQVIEKVSDIVKVESPKVNWLDYSGFKAVDKIKELADAFNIHPMLVEDIVNTNHLPKCEISDDYIAVLLKAYIPGGEKNGTNLDSICLVLTSRDVIDFHEKPHTYLDAKIDRIKNSKGKARLKGSDYLFYVLLDAYIDSYYIYFEDIRDSILDLEDELLSGNTENKTEAIHEIKKELTEFRKFLIPLKDSIGQLIREEPNLIEEENLIYFSDLQDHLNQLVEYYHSYTDMLKSLIDLNSSNINNNINQVMKVLTIIATIFIPLTFIAGIYGMNFEYMPELSYRYGYPIALGVMFVIGIVMLVYMKLKKWL